MVIIVMTRNKTVQLRVRRNADAPEHLPKNQTFCMEFTIANSGQRRFNQLRWKNYYVRASRDSSNIIKKKQLIPDPIMSLSR